ncbi:MAG: response regulator [Cyclobacteriaceae bacterium]
MKKILYVDDEEMNLQLLKMNLQGHYEVITEQYPEKAIEVVRNQGIEVVITDYKMPKMNGMELIGEIKKSFPNAMCMILSGYIESELFIDKSKIYQYILKPYSRSELINHIEKAFEGSQSMN